MAERGLENRVRELLKNADPFIMADQADCVMYGAPTRYQLDQYHRHLTDIVPGADELLVFIEAHDQDKDPDGNSPAYRGAVMALTAMTAILLHDAAEEDKSDRFEAEVKEKRKTTTSE